MRIGYDRTTHDGTFRLVRLSQYTVAQYVALTTTLEPMRDETRMICELFNDHLLIGGPPAVIDRLLTVAGTLHPD